MWPNGVRVTSGKSLTFSQEHQHAVTVMKTCFRVELRCMRWKKTGCLILCEWVVLCCKGGSKENCCVEVDVTNTQMPLGSMVINSISKLCRLGGSSMYTVPNAPSLADLEDDSDEEDKPEKPHFDSRSLIFELDPCNGNGKVCLVYKHTKPVVSPDTEIWFLDRALYWHFLTKTFTAYYRLLITHLGLPQWQYAFTSYGVSPQAKQWFNMYKPITINTTLLSEEADSFVNKLDPNKVFKSKNKTPVMKKKQPSQPAGVQKSNTSMPSTKTSSLAGNSSRKRDP
uniref:Tubulin polyglutamylase complex subunit 2 n=1 Tax=Pavo cristatus TaxID=9049 RepID=A0A8C9FF16_PAVCR